MLTQPGGFAERLRRIFVYRAAAVVPALGFQWIDAVHAAHQIHEAAAYGFAQFLLFVLHIQRDCGFARLEEVEQEQFEKIGFALAGVAQNQNVGRGLVLVPFVKVHQNICSVLVLANVEPVGIGFTTVIKWIQVGH